jgi:hypothetical protein
VNTLKIRRLTALFTRICSAKSCSLLYRLPSRNRTVLASNLVDGASMSERSPTSPRHGARVSPPLTPGRETFTADPEGSPMTPRRVPARSSGPLSKVTAIPSADMPRIGKVRQLRADFGQDFRRITFGLPFGSVVQRLVPFYCSSDTLLTNL